MVKKTTFPCELFERVDIPKVATREKQTIVSLKNELISSRPRTNQCKIEESQTRYSSTVLPAQKVAIV